MAQPTWLAPVHLVVSSIRDQLLSRDDAPGGGAGPAAV